MIFFPILSTKQVYTRSIQFKTTDGKTSVIGEVLVLDQSRYDLYMVDEVRPSAAKVSSAWAYSEDTITAAFFALQIVEKRIGKNMPDYSGSALLRILRNNPDRKNV